MSINLNLKIKNQSVVFGTTTTVGTSELPLLCDAAILIASSYEGGAAKQKHKLFIQYENY